VKKEKKTVESLYFIICPNYRINRAGALQKVKIPISRCILFSKS
jgi:hypothetical protein